MPLVRAVEKWGYAVDGKAAFLAAGDAVRNVVVFDIDRVMEAEAQIARGEGKPLAEVLLEIRDHPRADGNPRPERAAR